VAWRGVAYVMYVMYVMYAMSGDVM
jgi:hypothetical protein